MTTKKLFCILISLMIAFSGMPTYAEKVTEESSAMEKATEGYLEIIKEFSDFIQYVDFYTYMHGLSIYKCCK